MTCVHAGCDEDATMRCRFGDGLYRNGGGAVHRQTFVHYCDPHYALVDGLFVLCDVGPANRPNGPLRAGRA